MKRYVIRNKFRFFITICLIMMISMSSVFIVVVNARDGKEVSMMPEYVEQGDTIWELSEKYAGDMDIRDYISRVIDINNLESANIKPGELLYFPVY